MGFVRRSGYFSAPHLLLRLASPIKSATYIPLNIVYDPPKRVLDIEKHGLDFADLDMDFFALATIVPAKAGRFLAIGEFRDQIGIVVIFVPLGSEAVSVILMRPASTKERKLI